MSFDLDLCVHIGECLRGQQAVFQLNRRPWVLPDEGELEELVTVVRRCPSGALLYRRLDGGPEEGYDTTTVTPIRDGPLLVVGRVEFQREDGSVEVLPRATLCRCGESLNKPFCDNRHLAAGFKASGRPYKIHLTPVRPRTVGEPIEKAADPRR